MIASPQLGDELRAMLAGATDGAFVGGENRRIILWNRAATHIMGYTATEALGRACCELFDGREEAGPLHDSPSVMMQVETPVRAFDVCTTTKAGRPLWLHLTVFPVQPRKGAALVVHLFRDVTPTRQLIARVRERVAASNNGAVATRLGHGPLTHRELEVLRLTAQGLNTGAIAERLHISRATARNHAQNILWKLEVHNRLQAVAYATRHGLL